MPASSSPLSDFDILDRSPSPSLEIVSNMSDDNSLTSPPEIMSDLRETNNSSAGDQISATVEEARPSSVLSILSAHSDSKESEDDESIISDDLSIILPDQSLWKKHERFFFEDGTVTFMVEDMTYRVYQHYFTRDSPTFAEQIFPAHFGKGRTFLEKLHRQMTPIVLQDIKARDFDAFLSILYPSTFEDATADVKDVEGWTSVLHLASRWHIESMRALAIERLAAIASPFDKLVLGRTYSVEDWLVPAYTALCEREELLSDEECQRLSMQDIILICRVRETSLREFVPACPSCSYASLYCRQCGQYNTSQVSLKPMSSATITQSVKNLMPKPTMPSVPPPALSQPDATSPSLHDANSSCAAVLESRFSAQEKVEDVADNNGSITPLSRAQKKMAKSSENGGKGLGGSTLKGRLPCSFSGSPATMSGWDLSEPGVTMTHCTVFPSAMADKYNDFLQRLSGTPSSKKDDSVLLEPYAYIVSNPGKEIRGEMVEAFDIWLNVPEKSLKLIARVISMLHNASLLIDDIEDDSQLRRGQPVAHKIYGIPQTINAANYAYFLAYQELFSLRRSPSEKTGETASERLYTDTNLDKIVNDELLNLHRGQGLELLWRDSLQCPTEDEYIAMVNDKTGGLFRVAVKLMMACATTNVNVDYVPLVNLISVYFQIRDDYMNLQSSEYATNKGFAEDLTEGKFSFPIVHAVRSDLSNRQVLNVLQKRPTTPTLKAYTISYLRNHTKSFDYTLRVLHNLEKQTSAEIQRLGGNLRLQAIIDSLRVSQEAES
ncbi:hypothetical protein EW146_g8122 [Bondarzewia mesenterica]|uniref:(2E,6E)-farnesyl diphosphate synthase n=1 Tax=Bondarzewia mesenterica TaxID=1095465 RepID=A0A4S4LH00_9AGAM|nr:hypothetical protein EW146_g8122 [Bondarzewia mesenterica]